MAGAVSGGLDVLVPRGGLALPGLAALGHVSRATVVGFECVLFRDGAPAVRIEAARSATDARSGDLALEQLRIVHLTSGRTLRAARALWRRRGNDFVVRGEYALEDAGGVTTGRGVRVDADVRVEGGT